VNYSACGKKLATERHAVDIIKYAKIATQAWESFIKTDNNRQRIRNYFHLRPTNSGVTIVTTLNDYEMRGVPSIKDAEKLLIWLEKIDKGYEVLTSLNNEKKKKEIMKHLGFPKRKNVNNRKLEEKTQAIMINTMTKDKNLKGELSAKNPIRFIASELIFEQGKHRIDIVGYDEQDIYFFELKKGRTKAVEQVKDYVEYYSKRDKYVVLKQLLENYPINFVKKIKRLIGVMVMEHAENSVKLKAWPELAKRNKIHILSYKHSLMYENIAE